MRFFSPFIESHHWCTCRNHHNISNCIHLWYIKLRRGKSCFASTWKRLNKFCFLNFVKMGQIQLFVIRVDIIFWYLVSYPSSKYDSVPDCFIPPFHLGGIFVNELATYQSFLINGFQVDIVGISTELQRLMNSNHHQQCQIGLCNNCISVQSAMLIAFAVWARLFLRFGKKKCGITSAFNWSTSRRKRIVSRHFDSNEGWRENSPPYLKFSEFSKFLCCPVRNLLRWEYIVVKVN